MCGARAAYQQTADRDEELRERLVELACERPRFGYRRLGVLLARRGERVNTRRQCDDPWNAGCRRPPPSITGRLHNPHGRIGYTQRCDIAFSRIPAQMLECYSAPSGKGFSSQEAPGSCGVTYAPLSTRAGCLK